MIVKMKKSVKSLACASFGMLVLLAVFFNSAHTYATGKALLSISSGYGYRSDKVNISIILDNPKDIAGIQFTIKYDNSALSVSGDDVSKGSALSNWLFDKNVLSSKGEIKIACAGNSKLPETGSVNLCNIVFTIKADADLGKTHVSLESVYAGNGTEKLTIDSVNGMINVLSKATETVSANPSPASQTTPKPISPTNTPAATSMSTQEATSTVNPVVTALKDYKATPKVNPVKATEQPVSNLPAAGKYTDIEGHWAAQNILNLINSGIVSGYPDGTIKPDSKITRAEMITILIKALGANTVNNTGIGFKDKGDIPGWAFEYVCYAARNGIIKGYEDNTIRPDSFITRSEMAVITVNAFSLSTDGEENMNFSDIKNIPAWAEEYVSAAFRNNILKGYADNTIRPLNSITRAEAFVMLQRALDSRTS